MAGIGAAKWASDGETILYLRVPEDRTELNRSREHTPDENCDRDGSRDEPIRAFRCRIRIHRSLWAPAATKRRLNLRLVRAGRRELTVCEHRASNAEAVAPCYLPTASNFLSER